MTNLEKAKENYLLIDKILSKYATKSLDSIRFKKEDSDLRTPFARDADRIIHSLSYTRYMNKTQVYSFKENDHISKRIVHVQFVSKIGRTIGRALRLNTDLIEAIALGHDIGHTPLGHFGESVLNEISERELHESFAHNIQSMRHFMYVESCGKGLNLSVQVLDGFMCHNGEIVENKYMPEEKTKEEVMREYESSYKHLKEESKHSPMTMEGCVVRISDIIAYVGRDIEDSIALGLFKREEIPKEITDILGNNNRDIINTITTDIIENSMDKPYIMMSDKVFKALFKLKDFNYENIYSKAMSEDEKEYFREGINKLYDEYKKDLEDENKDSLIYRIFLDEQVEDYNKKTSNERKVLDFIAGMTDDMLSALIGTLNK